MKKVVSILVFVFISFLLISFFPINASACSCAEPFSVEKEFERSNAVFSGKVLEIREKKGLKGYMTRSVLFEVTSTWKGIQQSQIIIATGLGGGDCGIDFKEEQEYLVYAYESTMYGEKKLITTICDRTNKLSASQEDLIILGDGQSPNEIVDLTEEHKGNQLYMWGAIVAVIVIGLAVIIVLRRRKA